MIKKVYIKYCSRYWTIFSTGLRSQCEYTYADVAELADALVLGTSTNGVGVQVPSSAPNNKTYVSIEISIFYIGLFY